MLTVSGIRSRFIEFFEKKNHAILPSSSLVPTNDPTLLFTNAGMVQFKTIFQGKEKPVVTTAATVQKCVRAGGKHNDLENVGRTARHHTFFEMLGNFSFGAYFKKEAIQYAWEFITEELGLDKSRLYVTVFLDDDEAFTLWHKECGLEKERIFRLGEKDNFWAMGDTGPCGPCSEIFVDQGEELRCGDSCGIGSCDCDRFLEIWNLVFMQFDQQSDGTRIALPKPSIDTGIGLERLTAICQGVYSNYDTNLFQEIIAYISSLTEGRYIYKHNGEEVDIALRVIADHSRAIAFLLADGIVPSNEGRGYVLRRILRRAYRFGRELGFTTSFLYKVVAFVASLMGKEYPELLSNTTFMEKIVEREEQSFNRTLDNGLLLLEEMFEKERLEKSSVLRGEDAFLLHDTYGFPIDIVNDIAQKQGFRVELAVFEACIVEQKERARQAWKGSDTDALQKIYSHTVENTASHFVGYTQDVVDALVQQVYTAEGEKVDILHEGDYGYCVLTQSPFYATAGGQESDTGRILSDTAIAECIGAELSPSGAIVHSIHILSGVFHINTTVEARIDTTIRKAIARNHTATHIAFSALRAIVSDTTRQAGSLVTAEKLRFDYTALKPLTQEEILDIEHYVNTIVQQALPANLMEMEYKKAVEDGAMSLAGEKYGDIVRVIAFGDVSKELCCGTHVENTGEIGAFIITSESGLATGVRRIEAITGMRAIEYIQENRKTLGDMAQQMKCPLPSVTKQMEVLLEERKTLQRTVEEQAQQLAIYTAKSLESFREDIGEYSVLMCTLSHTPQNTVKTIIEILRPSYENGIIALATATENTVHISIFTGKGVQYTAKALLEHIAPILDAKGGGKPDFVQAGGKNPHNIGKAFDALREMMQKG